MLATASRSLAGCGLAVCVAAVVSPVRAQVVMQVEGGGNSVTGGYGGTARFWTRESEGWVGAGYADGWRLGGYGKTIVRGDTIGVGSKFESLSLPTDLFNAVPYMLMQGLEWKASRRGTRFGVAGGLAGTGVSAPHVNTVRADRPVVAAVADRRVRPDLLLAARALFSAQQTMYLSGTWRTPGSPNSVNASLGLGANRPYGALSAAGQWDRFEYTASLVGFKRGFRRADVPLPSISESVRENVTLRAQLTRTSALQIGRQHFRPQPDSLGQQAPDVTVHQLLASKRHHEFVVYGGAFHTQTDTLRSASAFITLGHEFRGRFNNALSLYSTQADGGALLTATLTSRQVVTPRINLLQLVTRSSGNTSVGFGGSYQSGFTAIAVDYKTVYVPMRRPDPFLRTLALSVKLQLGRYSTNVASTVDPFGNVNYTASGSTFLYLGEFGTTAAPLTVKFERFLVHGVVVLDDGTPLEGAAIEVGSEFAITNSRGEFSIRMPRPGEQPLRVALAEFLMPGAFEVVEAPGTATAQPEERATPIRIVVRRRGSRPSPPAPTPSPVPAPPPEGSRS